MEKGDSQRYFGFACDITYIKPDSFNSLQDKCKYISFHEIAECSSLPNYYITCACVCSIYENMIVLSDLYENMFTLEICSPLNIRINDIVLISNAIHVTNRSLKHVGSILPIGHINKVVRCKYATEDSHKCSIYVDPKERQVCVYHAKMMISEPVKQVTKQVSVSIEPPKHTRGAQLLAAFKKV